MALLTETYCLSSKQERYYLSPLQGQTPPGLPESSPLLFPQAGLLIFGVLLISSGSQTKSLLCVSASVFIDEGSGTGYPHFH